MRSHLYKNAYRHKYIEINSKRKYIQILSGLYNYRLFLFSSGGFYVFFKFSTTCIDYYIIKNYIWIWKNEINILIGNISRELSMESEHNPHSQLPGETASILQRKAHFPSKSCECV